MAEVAAKILLDAEFASTVLPKLKRQASMMEAQLRMGGKMFDSKGVRDFTNELDRANQRVITLGIAFQSLRTVSDTLSGITRASIEVEKAFTDINSVFELTTDNLDKFGKQLFEVARDTSQGFKNVAESAKEFSRQGLSAEETLKRVKSALTLSRVASIDVVDSVNVLTASINGFAKAGLTAADITNKLLAVDTKFAVSAGDLADALARSGSAASDAGVQFDELLGIITAVQQTTARGGAVIGNSLKTIFTRIQRQDTIEALDMLGVKTTDVNNRVLSGIELLENFSQRYDQLGDSAKRSAAEIVGGVYQINILKAAIGDLSKAESIYQQARKASAEAGDEETKRNEALNKSLDATITRLGLAGKQIGANIGNLGFSQFARTGLNLLTENPITKALEDASGKAESIGGKVAEGFIKGFGNAVLIGLGPILLRAVSNITAITFGKITTDLLQAADTTPLQAYTRGRQGRMTRRSAEGYIPNAAGSYIPFSEESSAISKGVGGAPLGAKPVLLNNFKYGGGMTGPILANSSEYIVPNFANGGSAIFNQNMIKQYGLPPGSTPVAAGGYIPNAAGGLPTGYTGMGGIPYKYPIGMGGVPFYQYLNMILGIQKSTESSTLPTGSVLPPMSGSGAFGKSYQWTKIMGGAPFPYYSKANSPTIPAEASSLKNFPALSAIVEGAKAYEKASEQLSKKQGFSTLSKQRELTFEEKFAQGRQGYEPDPSRLSDPATKTQRRNLKRAKKKYEDYLDKELQNAIKQNQIEEDYSNTQKKQIQLREQLASQAKEENKLADEVASSRKEIVRQQREGGEKLDKKYGLSLALKTRNLTFGKPEPFSATFVPGADPNAPTVREQMSMQQSLQAVRQAVANENARYAITASLARRGGPDAPDTFFSKNYPTFQKFIQGRRGISENAATALSFGLPFAAGFVPERPGGTQAGMISGAASGALMGAGLGIGIGSAIPAVGTLVGGGIGLVGGGVIGLISKMNESFEEMTIRLENVSKNIKSELDSALKILELQEQLAEALATGQNLTAKNIQEQILQLRSNVSNPQYLNIINQPTGQRGSVQQRREALRGVGFGSIETNIRQTTAETLASELKSKQGALGDFFGETEATNKEIQSFSKRFASLLGNYTEEQLANLEQLSAKNRPAMGRQAGQYGAQEALIEVFKSTGFEFSGAATDIPSTFAIPTIREAIRIARQQRSAPVNQRKFSGTSPLLSPAEIRSQYLEVGRQADLQLIKDQSRLQLQSFRQNLLLQAPESAGLTDSQREILSGGYKAQNIFNEFLAQQQFSVQQTSEQLLEATKEFAEPQYKTPLLNLRTLQDLQNLRQKLSTSEGKKELPIASQKFNEILDKSIRELELARERTTENVRNALVQAAETANDIESRLTSIGLIDLTEGEITRTTDTLDKLIKAGAPPELLQTQRSRITSAKITRGYLFQGPQGGSLNKYQELLNEAEKNLREAQDSLELPERIRQLTEIRDAAKVAFTTRQSGLRAGTIEENRLLIERLKEDLEQLKNAGRSPEITQAIESELRQAEITRDFLQTRDEFRNYAASLANSADQERRAMERSAMAVEGVLRNPTMPGAQYVTGAQISGGLMSGARVAGLEGKSGESFFGGFRSVIAGAKRDLQDFSEIGANIANSLQSNLGNAFGDFVTGAKSAKDAFKDFTLSVLNDASRAFASKAVQGLLMAGFQALGMPLGATGGQFTGSAFKFAKGGKVPALLTGGEYVIPPDAARSIGYDTLRKINRYADGGLVNGGSGVKDDVPARLAPGSFVIKKATVDRLGPDYFHSLSNGGVQKRWIGGAIVGALIGGGLGYATGGKKGAIGGAILGGIAGGVYSYNAAQSAASQSYGQELMIRGDPSTVSAAAPATMSTGTKLALMGGASVGLGLLSAGIAAPKKESQAISLSEVPRYAAQLEAEQEKTFATNRFAYLGRNSGGGYSIGSFGPAPATRRFAGGGMVGGETQMAMDFMPRFANGGEVEGGAPLSIQSPTSSGGSGNAPNVNVKIEINNNGQMSSSKSSTGGANGGAFNEDFANKLESAIRPVVQDEIIRQMRNDGIFSQRSRFVNNF